MNADRLKILACALEAIPPAQFNFESVVHGAMVNPHKLECGSTTCAIGLLPMIPEFADLGVEYIPPSLLTLRNEKEVEVIMPGISPTTFNSSFKTAESLFDISSDEVSYLFVPKDESDNNGRLSSDASAKDVAAHIRAFIDRKSIL